MKFKPLTGFKNSLLKRNFSYQLETANTNTNTNPFLSTKSLNLQLNHLQSLLQTTSQLIPAFNQPDSKLQPKHLFNIIEKCSKDPFNNPRLLHFASQAWNLDFFLQGLVSVCVECVCVNLIYLILLLFL